MTAVDITALPGVPQRPWCDRGEADNGWCCGLVDQDVARAYLDAGVPDFWHASIPVWARRGTAPALVAAWVPRPGQNRVTSPVDVQDLIDLGVDPDAAQQAYSAGFLCSGVLVDYIAAGGALPTAQAWLTPRLTEGNVTTLFRTFTRLFQDLVEATADPALANAFVATAPLDAPRGDVVAAVYAWAGSGLDPAQAARLHWVGVTPAEAHAHPDLKTAAPAYLDTLAALQHPTAQGRTP